MPSCSGETSRVFEMNTVAQAGTKELRDKKRPMYHVAIIDSRCLEENRDHRAGRNIRFLAFFFATSVMKSPLRSELRRLRRKIAFKPKSPATIRIMFARLEIGTIPILFSLPPAPDTPYNRDATRVYLHVCAYLCICIILCIHTDIYICTILCIHIHRYMYIYLHIHIHICVCVCIRGYWDHVTLTGSSLGDRNHS